jgi:hypothetical protein
MPKPEREPERELRQDERAALATLIHYHLMKSNAQGKSLSQAWLGGEVTGLKEFVDAHNAELTTRKADRTSKLTPGKVINNILFKGAEQGSQILKRHYREVIHDRGEVFVQPTPPAYIQAAIELLYRPDELAPSAELAEQAGEAVRFSLENVFSRIRHKNEEDRQLLGKNYGGIWDVVRYSAHQYDNPTPRDHDDPWVVRSAVQIGPMDRAKGYNEPWFKMHYRPRGDEGVRLTTGSLMLIDQGQYFCFFGREHDADAPIYLVARFVRRPQTSFRALVLRLHSHGRMLCSRVSFVRSRAATLEALNANIDVFRESTVIKRFTDEIPNLKQHLENAINDIPNEGKCVLILR